MTRPILFDTLGIDTLDVKTQHTIGQIDNLLPQTQCGLCGYKNGCLPYAHAIVVNGEKPNLCVPGGDTVSRQIADITCQPFIPAVSSKWQTNPNTNRPTKMLAIIDELSCIGCTKCIPACPVDAIIGTAKHMHSVADSFCTGCELCVAPCPVDCITLVPHTNQHYDNTIYREQYYHHLNRIAQNVDNKPITSHTESLIASTLATQTAIDKDDSQQVIKLAKLRTQIKKLEKQLAVQPNDTKQAELKALTDELIRLQS